MVFYDKSGNFVESGFLGDDMMPKQKGEKIKMFILIKDAKMYPGGNLWWFFVPLAKKLDVYYNIMFMYLRKSEVTHVIKAKVHEW